VPDGQTEAAQAIGLSPLRTTYLIVLPQALRNVIPALVGQFISLFKDTSLVTFLGLLELLGVAQVILEQPDFRGAGLQTETLIFASLIYWSWCYSMSRASQRLETRLGVGER
jgi:general L-amino acid transport system permease protein